ncbi:MAG: amylo-alpha-1,6-glucosidase [Candidatus Promineifilaceae bacterium]
MTKTLGRGSVNDPAVTTVREWLVTNGIGGYACGTVAGVLTRGYHGYLLAALKPPVERTLLVSKFDESVKYNGIQFPLFTNQWSPHSLWNDGYIYLDSFRLEGTTPVWTYTLADAWLEKRLWMEQGSNTTYVRYDLIHAHHPMTIDIKALVNYRDYHGKTSADGWNMDVHSAENGLRIIAKEGATPYYLLSSDAQFTPQHSWHRNYYRSIEAYRGQDEREDHLQAAVISAELTAGDSITIVLSTEETPDLNGHTAYKRQKQHEQMLLGRNELPEEISDLVLAADQFIVKRAHPDNEDGRSIIAGYPWFSDWGRDTMIALPGLTLATGRPAIAKQILQTYAQFVDQGMLPNRFPDQGEEPEYNTVDATLWYFEALHQYYEATGDQNLLCELWPILADIVNWHVRGTRYQIRVDSNDGLLFAGEPGVQLTWMDAKVDDWVVTPRVGKPVEINALWYNALRIMIAFAPEGGAEQFKVMADQVEANFGRFWNEELNCCYDVIDAHDAKIRPNQLLAASLTYSPFSAEKQKAIVDACAKQLVTPHGLRSLSPRDPDYIGTYGGDRYARDGAYHQGTTWGWLIGPFITAHLKVYNDVSAADRYLDPLIRHLNTGCIGSLSEIFDGKAPYTPRGCFAQAWTVAEVLRAWTLIKAKSEKESNEP